MLPTFNEISMQIDEKICRFSIQSGMTFAHIKEVLCQLQKYIGNLEDQAKAKQEEEEKLKQEIIVDEPPEAS